MTTLADVRAAFAPQSFKEHGHALIDTLGAYLERAIGAAPMPVLPWLSPNAQATEWSLTDKTQLLPLLERVVASSNHLHHPHYIGHQVSSPLPTAALCDLVSALLNNGTAIYEMGPVTTIFERQLVAFFCRAAGLPEGADGIFTSGGSAGNLTALLAARQAKAGFDVWQHGLTEGPPLAVLTSTQSHYSVQRSLQVMGLGKDGAVAVPVDAQFRLDPSALAQAKARAEATGRRVIAVVASAGSTATGAFDPLDAVADFCVANDLWFHVDGAHGATALLSSTHAERLRGIERADSIVWDAHKMMLMPALVTAVLFREQRRSYEAFAQEASYLFSPADPAEQWFNSGTRTLECTKTMMSLKLWATLNIHGPAFFGAYLDAMFELGQRFAALVEATPDFELAVQPDCNIVCFRYTPSHATDLDALQNDLRRLLLERGHFYIVQTKLPRGVYLRVAIMNPFTEEQHLARLLDEVRDIAQEHDAAR